MMELQSRAWLLGAVVLVACEGGSGTSGTDPTEGATDSDASATGTATDPSAGPATDPSAGPGDATDTADTDSADATATDGATDSADTTAGSDTDGPAGLEVSVLPSSVAVLEADELGELTVECELREDGVPVTAPGAFTVMLSPNEGFSEAGGVYTFPDAALFDVTCATEVDGQALQATQTIAVLNEAIDPGVAELGAGMGTALEGISRVLAAHEQDDALLTDAIVRLDAALPRLQSTRVTELQDVLREMPGDYPTGPEMEAMGIMPNADDAALGAALDQLEAALGAYEATMAAADPMSADEAPLTALEADQAAFEAAVGELMALEPSPHGLLAQRNRVASLMGQGMQPAMHQASLFLSEHIHAQFAPAPDGTSRHFGLLGLTLGMFNQSYIRVKLVNDWYGDYIAQLDESINNFILAGALDIVFPVGEEGPVIELLQASASLGFATPGYDSWIDGYNFDESDGGFNLVLVFGDSWQGIVDNIIGACGIEDSDSIPEAVEKFRSCVEDIEAAVDSIFWYPVSVGPGLFGSEQGLDMGPFPDACGGGLPTATFVMPMTWRGRGPNYFVNCI